MSCYSSQGILIVRTYYEVNIYGAALSRLRLLYNGEEKRYTERAVQKLLLFMSKRKQIYGRAG